MTLTEAIVFVAPEKHGRHIGIMTPSASSSSSVSLSVSASYFWLPIPGL